MPDRANLKRAAFVAAGYLAAFLIALGVAVVHVATTSTPEAEAESGMRAFAEVVLFLMVFIVLSLVPSGAAIYFWLRRGK